MTAIDSASTADIIERDIKAYVDSVSLLIEDIPDEERAELLDDLRNHLREIVSENPDASLDECVGKPDEYARELLLSAGVSAGNQRKQSRSARFRNRYQDSLSSVTNSSIGRAWSENSPFIKPVWWAVRAYLATSLIAAITRNASIHRFNDSILGYQASHPGFPIPRVFDNETIGIITLLAAFAISIAIGKQTLRTAMKRTVIAANVVLALYGMALYQRTGPTQQQVVYIPSGSSGYEDVCLRNGGNVNITNLYPYDMNGNLLNGVLIFDQTGSPINNLCPEVDNRGRALVTEYAIDANGAPVYGVFPRKQSVQELHPSGSNEFKPVRPPAVVIPRVVTGGTTTATTTVAHLTSGDPVSTSIVPR